MSERQEGLPQVIARAERHSAHIEFGLDPTIVAVATDKVPNLVNAARITRIATQESQPPSLRRRPIDRGARGLGESGAPLTNQGLVIYARDLSQMYDAANTMSRLDRHQVSAIAVEELDLPNAGESRAEQLAGKIIDSLFHPLDVRKRRKRQARDSSDIMLGQLLDYDNAVNSLSRWKRVLAGAAGGVVVAAVVSGANEGLLDLAAGAVTMGSTIVGIRGSARVKLAQFTAKSRLQNIVIADKLTPPEPDSSEQG
jgi:hypothetical protein